MTFSDEQKVVIDAIRKLQAGESIYVDGPGGVGKSTTIEFALRGVSNVIRMAPTALAANNIGGCTIHRAFQLQGRLYLDEDPMGVQLRKLQAEYGFKEAGRLWHMRLSKKRKEALAIASYFWLDEAPATRCDLIDEMDRILRYVNKKPDVKFGGARMIFSGDLGQLQPVVTDDDEKALTAAGYSSPFGLFQAKVFQ